MKKLYLILVILLLSSIFISAQEDLKLPENIQKIKEYNKEASNEFIIRISFFIAFLAGILTFLSPCILPLLPAFFAYTFKERKNISKMTFIFFLGFTIMFTAMGMIAVALGKGTLIVLQNNISMLILIAGLILVGFGLSSIFGIGFAGLKIVRKTSATNPFGIFIYGLLFALGWTICTGPILSGTLLMVAIFRNYLFGISLMFSYSLGLFVPLFIASFLYDKFNLCEVKFIKGKEYNFYCLGKEFRTHTASVISGILFIIIGMAFIIFRRTSFLNGLDLFGVRQYFYSFQNIFLANPPLFNVVGGIILIAIAYLIYISIFKKRYE